MHFSLDGAWVLEVANLYVVPSTTRTRDGSQLAFFLQDQTETLRKFGVRKWTRGCRGQKQRSCLFLASTTGKEVVFMTAEVDGDSTQKT